MQTSFCIYSDIFSIYADVSSICQHLSDHDSHQPRHLCEQEPPPHGGRGNERCATFRYPGNPSGTRPTLWYPQISGDEDSLLRGGAGRVSTLRVLQSVRQTRRVNTLGSPRGWASELLLIQPRAHLGVRHSGLGFHARASGLGSLRRARLKSRIFAGPPQALTFDLRCRLVPSFFRRGCRTEVSTFGMSC